MGSYFSGYVHTDQEWIDLSNVREARPWWPQRCCVTNKLLWLKKAVLVRRVITGPGFPAVIDNWVDARAYTIQTLKGWN